MAVRVDKVQVEVEIGGKKAGQTLKELKNDVRALQRELDNLAPGTEEFNKKAAELGAAKAHLEEVKGQVDEVAGSMEEATGIGEMLKVALVAAFAAVAGAVVQVGMKVAEVVIGAEQVETKFRTVFGDAAGVVDDFARNNATSLGITKREFKDLASATGDLLVPLGLTRAEAARMSTESVKLAGALSMWTNGAKSTAEVSEILTKAMLGERDGLKSLGISITEAELQSVLLAKGQDKLTGSMLEQAKAIATNELIMKKSKDAQTAFENGAGSLAQRVSVAKAEFNQLWETLAGKLAPVVIEVVRGLGEMLGVVKGYGEEKFSDKLADEQAKLNGLVRSITQHNENTTLRKKLLDQLQAEYPSFLGNLNAEKVTNEQLLGRLKDVNEEYRKKILISAQDEIVKETMDKQQQALVGMAKAQRNVNEGMAIFNEILKANNIDKQVDLTASLQEQWRQYTEIGQEGLEAAMINQERFFDSNEEVQDSARAARERFVKELTKGNQEWLAGLIKIEGGMQQLLGKNTEYEISSRQLTAETENYDKMLKQLGLSLEEVDQLMSGAGDAANGAGDAEQQATEKIKKATEDKSAFYQKQAADMIAAAKAIQDMQVAAIQDPWQRRRAELELETTKKIQALVGTPEQVDAQYKLLKDQLMLALEQVDADESNMLAQIQANRDQHEREAVEARLRQMAEEQAQTELMLDLQYSSQEDAEEEHERRVLEIRRQAIEERMALLEQAGQQETAAYQQLANEKVKIQIKQNQQAVKNEERTAEIKKTIALAGVDAVSQALDLGIEALSRDEAARKKNATAIKAFSIGKVLVDLGMEIAGYMASPASTATGGVMGGILSALATARATLAIAKIQSQQFERGGIVYPNMGAFAAGVVKGPRHSGGGVRLTDGRTGAPIGEMEGGEPIMILSRHTYSNNREVVDRLIYSSLYRGGAPIFASGGVIAGPMSATGPVTQSEGDSGAGMLEVAAQLAGLRQDVSAWNTSIRAHIVWSDVQEADRVDQTVKRSSRIGGKP